jgi:hypothetical protein
MSGNGSKELQCEPTKVLRIIRLTTSGVGMAAGLLGYWLDGQMRSALFWDISQRYW